MRFSARDTPPSLVAAEWYDPEAAVRCGDAPRSHPAALSSGRARWNNRACASLREWIKAQLGLAQFQTDRRVDAPEGTESGVGFERGSSGCGRRPTLDVQHQYLVCLMGI